MNSAPQAPRRTDTLFIWLFAGAIALLAGYKLLFQDPKPAPVAPKPIEQPAAPPPPAEPPQQPTDLAGLPPDNMPNAAAEQPLDDKVYTYVEQMPQPPGGMEGLLQYFTRHVKYPAAALREQVEGKVFVNFIVRPDGHISDVQVTKGIGAGCDEEALRVVSQMPPWQPGKQNGRVVSVSYTVPITFTVQ
ncbi:energy transducer TonB [Hymenobacter sp. CRA2]|uniref:energy transducer TonB n=1 Tax=Hymenobacter sp. CRA2 TaxID=1955620 RepID=UPI00098F0236|nr:energy transducer TonB [Hymenobacter sp. CRA2]OON70747.1 hypothetical protein B0919_01655 [Hymenobacter sp. CRA2]